MAGCQHDLPATATTAARRCYHWTVALALLALGKRRCTGRCLQVGAVPGPKSAGASSCPQSLAVQGGTGSRFTVRKFRNSIQELPSRAPEFPDRAPELPDEALGISELPVVGYPRRPGAPRFPGPRPRAPGPGPGTPEPGPVVPGGGCRNTINILTRTIIWSPRSRNPLAGGGGGGSAYAPVRAGFQTFSELKNKLQKIRAQNKLGVHPWADHQT